MVPVWLGQEAGAQGGGGGRQEGSPLGVGQQLLGWPGPPTGNWQHGWGRLSPSLRHLPSLQKEADVNTALWVPQGHLARSSPGPGSAPRCSLTPSSPSAV